MNKVKSLILIIFEDQPRDRQSSTGRCGLSDFLNSARERQVEHIGKTAGTISQRTRADDISRRIIRTPNCVVSIPANIRNQQRPIESEFRGVLGAFIVCTQFKLLNPAQLSVLREIWWVMIKHQVLIAIRLAQIRSWIGKRLADSFNRQWTQTHAKEMLPAVAISETL